MSDKPLPKGDELRALIDSARKKIDGEAAEAVSEILDDGNDMIEVLGPKGDAIVSLSAELAALSAQEAAIKARKDQITRGLKALAPTAGTYGAHGAKVFTVSISRPVRLNTAVIKSAFDPADYPGLYLEGKEEVRLTLNPEFKKAAVEGATEAIER